MPERVCVDCAFAQVSKHSYSREDIGSQLTLLKIQKLITEEEFEDLTRSVGAVRRGEDVHMREVFTDSRMVTCRLDGKAYPFTEGEKPGYAESIEYRECLLDRGDRETANRLLALADGLEELGYSFLVALIRRAAGKIFRKIRRKKKED